ncbi:MAG: HesA/MoeB/ThiF family protein, partial [Steroidobacteraceae bacterium]
MPAAAGGSCPRRSFSLYLAAAGVGTLGLVDFDRVEVSNLQRQVLFGSADVARLKTQAGRERLLALNPEIAVIAHNLTLRADNVLEVLRDCDLVLDGTDRLTTRYVVNDACVLLGKPLVLAAIHRCGRRRPACAPPRAPQARRAGAPDAPTGYLGPLAGARLELVRLAHVDEGEAEAAVAVSWLARWRCAAALRLPRIWKAACSPGPPRSTR